MASKTDKELTAIETELAAAKGRRSGLQTAYDREIKHLESVAEVIEHLLACLRNRHAEIQALLAAEEKAEK